MFKETFVLFKCLLLSRLFHTTIGLPTIGRLDFEHLETYEDFSSESSEFDRFLGNLTFRFSCENMPIGLYADVDYNCKVFHACDHTGDGFPVICPKNTFFDQRERICTDVEDVDCEHAHEWFHLNELSYSGEVTEESELKSSENEEVPSVLPLLYS